MYTAFASDVESSLAQTISKVSKQERNLKIMAQICDGEAVLACIDRIRPEIIFLDSALLETGDLSAGSCLTSKKEDYDPIVCFVSQESGQKMLHLLLSFETSFLSIIPAMLGENEDELHYVVKSRLLSNANDYDEMRPKWEYPEVRAVINEGEISDLMSALGAPPQLRSTKTLCTACPCA